MNERITEEFVRSHFKADPLFNIIKLEEQKSNNGRIKELLQLASKAGKSMGKPEFIISFPIQNSNYIIIIECKSDVTKHASANHDKIKDFAVDDVLHYAKFFSNEYDVIAIAVSGQTDKEMRISTFQLGARGGKIC